MRENVIYVISWVPLCLPIFLLGGRWTVMQKIHCQKYVSLSIKEAAKWLDRCRCDTLVVSYIFTTWDSRNILFQFADLAIIGCLTICLWMTIQFDSDFTTFSKKIWNLRIEPSLNQLLHGKAIWFPQQLLPKNTWALRCIYIYMHLRAQVYI